jgi:hypothetical protein
MPGVIEPSFPPRPETGSEEGSPSGIEPSIGLPCASPGLVEVLVIWAIGGALLVSVFVTYARVPAADLYRVSGSGLNGGASRALIAVNFPLALIAMPLLGIAVRCAASWHGLRRAGTAAVRGQVGGGASGSSSWGGRGVVCDEHAVADPDHGFDQWVMVPVSAQSRAGADVRLRVGDRGE